MTFVQVFINQSTNYTGVIQMNNPINKYEHILRLWPVVMAGNPMTLIEYLAESDKDQNEFYTWICNQVGEYADLY
jgi:hypothetical protein